VLSFCVPSVFPFVFRFANYDILLYVSAVFNCVGLSTGRPVASVQEIRCEKLTFEIEERIIVPKLKKKKTKAVPLRHEDTKQERSITPNSHT
jgi:hypothetical protein